MEATNQKLNIHLTKEDYKKFVMLFHRGRFISFAVFFVFLLAIMLLPPLLFGWGFDFMAVLPVLFYGFIISLSYFSLIYQANTVYKTDVSINSPFEAILDSEGVNTISSRGNTKYEWKDLYGYKIKEDVIYIFYTQVKALILPTRFFNDEEQKNQMILFIKQIDNKKYESLVRRRMWLRILVYLALFIFMFWFLGGAFLP